MSYEHFASNHLHYGKTVHLWHSAERLHHPHTLQQLRQQPQESLQLLSILISVKHHIAAPSDGGDTSVQLGNAYNSPWICIIALWIQNSQNQSPNYFMFKPSFSVVHEEEKHCSYLRRTWRLLASSCLAVVHFCLMSSSFLWLVSMIISWLAWLRHRSGNTEVSFRFSALFWLARNPL